MGSIVYFVLFKFHFQNFKSSQKMKFLVHTSNFTALLIREKYFNMLYQEEIISAGDSIRIITFFVRPLVIIVNIRTFDVLRCRDRRYETFLGTSPNFAVTYYIWTHT